MGRFLHYRGFRFNPSDSVKAPKQRLELPCYDKSICQVEHCSKYDTIVREEIMTYLGEEKTEHRLYRNPCDEDCKRRINLDDVSVKVCIKVKCEFFSPEGCYCKKYVEENSLTHKPAEYKEPHRIDRRGAIGGWHYREF